MKTIWRYRLPSLYVEEQTFYLDVPLGAEFLPGIHEKNGELFVYAIVNPTSEMRQSSKFVSLGTGREYSDAYFEKSKYIGTWRMRGYVWHVFEVN